jgi:uncharacterized membrane protein YoaK (UPF0700 family)
MVNGSEPSTMLLVTLTVLTVVSGLVDAVSYLGLGHVFTANMTGNVVLLGFAAAGAPGFSIAASLASLGSFLVGAAVAGRMTLHVTSRRQWLLIAMSIEGLFAGVAATVSAIHSGAVASGSGRYAIISVLAFAMGVRNSTIRRLAVPDITTTVLTMTLTGLAADSSLAGGSNPKVARRSSAVAAMLVGAVSGAALYLHNGTTWPLVVVAVTVLAMTLVFGVSASSRQLDVTGDARGAS